MSNFIYCLNSSTIRLAPILEKIKVAATAGYAAIELWHDDIDDYLATGGQLADIRKALDDHQLEAPTTIMIKGWLDTIGEIHDRCMDEVKRRMNQSAELGIPYVIAGPPLGAVDANLAASQYGKLLALGKSIGVRPSMEYLGFAQKINSIDYALDIITNCGEDGGTIVLDPFHCFLGNGGMESIGKLSADQISISHFNDAPSHPPRRYQLDPDRVLPGDGIYDLKNFVSLLKETGYQRWISLEVFRRDLWGQEPLEVAKVGLEKMRAVVED